jgi:hypothetical protein
MTSIAVTHDMKAPIMIAERHLGTPDEIQATRDPILRQFIEGSSDGPLSPPRGLFELNVAPGRVRWEWPDCSILLLFVAIAWIRSTGSGSGRVITWPGSKRSGTSVKAILSRCAACARGGDRDHPRDQGARGFGSTRASSSTWTQLRVANIGFMGEKFLALDPGRRRGATTTGSRSRDASSRVCRK